MPLRHLVVFWPVIWLFLGGNADAQSLQSGGAPVAAAQAAAGLARGIAATVLTSPTMPAPATGLTTARGDGEGLALAGPAVNAPGLVGAAPMPEVSTPRPVGTPLVLSSPGASPAATVGATPVVSQRAPRVQSIALEAGTGRIVTLSAPAASIFAADPRVAEVRPASPTSLFVLGIAAGRTTIAAIGDAGAAIAQYDVTVLPSSYSAAQAQSAIAAQFPGQNVHVATRPNGLVVSGTVPAAAEADQAMQTARDFAGAGQTVESRLAVVGGQQVNLRVRIAEVSRNVIRQLGINWSNLASLGQSAAIGVVTGNPLANTLVSASVAALSYSSHTANHTLDINAVIDAMAQDQLVHVLAEPNLTAMSGETASFLVGGEFPIPIAQQNNQVTVEFKQYGVSLAFVPTVLSNGRINMRVRPEVSALSTQGAVQLGVGNSSIQVPALTVRRAETTVELASGQSFAIAGLLQDNTTMNGNALPGIGEIPILGALFRSDSFQRNETELVIVITPYLVSGVANPSKLKLPTDGWKPPGDLERILLLRQSARETGSASPAPHIPGDAGFLVR
jgi:pilus assembly protein CpaC